MHLTKTMRTQPHAYIHLDQWIPLIEDSTALLSTSVVYLLLKTCKQAKTLCFYKIEAFKQQ